MSSESILRIPRSDSPGDFALIKVSKAGSAVLDLQLIGTEGENPYVGSLKTTGITKLRAKNYRGDDDEWGKILSYLLGQSQEIDAQLISGLEIQASVQSDSDDEDADQELHLTLRKRIDSITQKLGTVILKQDDEQAIELFEWTGTAVFKAKTLGEQLSSLQTKYREAEDTIKKLNTQLEEFIEAKNQHEEQLIGKFVGLLNEKKAKIRTQQRQLAGFKGNTDTAAEPEQEEAQEQEVTSKRPSRKPAASRRTKRKADEPPPEQSESDDGFDKMDIDKAGNAAEAEAEDDDSTNERQETPEPLEDETASEVDDEVRPAPAPAPVPKKGTRTASKGKKTPAPDPPAKATRSTRASSAKPQISEPPPPRELPFGKKKAAPKTAPKPVIEENEDAADGGASDSEDDEL